MTNHSIIIFCLLLSFTVISKADQDDINTALMIQDFIARYSIDVVTLSLPCLPYADCGNCTAQFGCVWTTKGTTNGITIFQGGDPVKIYSNIRFCWKGGFFGGWYKSVDVVGDTVNAYFGWNDYMYQQCGLR